MNVITDIGNFLIAYADYVETALIVLAIAAVLVLVVIFARGAKEKKQILTDISDNVEKINTAVNRFNDKSKDVIYIDNRAQAPSGAKEKDPGSQDLNEIGEDELEEITDSIPDGGKPEEEPVQEEKPETPKKFTTRDCAVSKQGREYTLEELIEQIKK